MILLAVYCVGQLTVNADGVCLHLVIIIQPASEWEILIISWYTYQRKKQERETKSSATVEIARDADVGAPAQTKS